MTDRSWVWYDHASHIIRGYGTGISVYMRERAADRGFTSWYPDFNTVCCLTWCNLRIEVHVPEDSSLADAAQPKRVPICPKCMAKKAEEESD